MNTNKIDQSNAYKIEFNCCMNSRKTDNFNHTPYLKRQKKKNGPPKLAAKNAADLIA